MRWLVYCKDCQLAFRISSESVATDQPKSDGAISLTCPYCAHGDRYTVADIVRASAQHAQ